MRIRVKSVHKYISLGFCLVWLTQAITGTFIVFRWELDDAFLGGETRPLDYAALARQIIAIDQTPDMSVSSVWTSGGYADRYDVFAQTAAGSEVIRIDGGGNILRKRTEGTLWADGGIYDTFTSLHASLFSGTYGKWFIGLSGILLVTNIILGLKLAWPGTRQFRRALLTWPAGQKVSKLFEWHRLTGFWLGIPAVFVVFFGSLLAFEGPIWKAFGVNTDLPFNIENPENTPAPFLLEKAIGTALAAHPGARLSGLYMPEKGSPYFIIRLLTTEEPATKYGKTAVYVSAYDGAILANHPATAYPARRQAVNLFFSAHTGQMFGMTGRLVSLAVGLWLIVMIVLGIRLYLARRRKG